MRTSINKNLVCGILHQDLELKERRAIKETQTLEYCSVCVWKCVGERQLEMADSNNIENVN